MSDSVKRIPLPEPAYPTQSLQADTQSNPAHKSSLWVFLVCLNSSLSSFYVGYSLVYISTLEDFSTIIEIYGVDFGSVDVTQSIVTGCIPIGAIFGALSSSIFLRKFSRKNCFLVNNALAVIAMGIVLVKSSPTILIGRLLQGFCTGMYSAIVPLYINEFAPTSLSKFGTLNQIMISCAQSFVFFFYFLLTDPFEATESSSWNFVSNFLILTIVLQTLVFWFIFPFETPKYLLTVRKDQKCRQLLRTIYAENSVEMVYRQLKETVQSASQEGNREQIETAPTSNKNDSQIEDIKSVRDSELLLAAEESGRRMCKLAVFLAIHIALYQQLTGVNSVALYGGKIVNSVFPDLNKIIPIFTNMLPAVMSGLTAGLMKRYGRKTLLQLGGVLLVIPLTMMSVGFIAEAHTESDAPKILVVAALFLYMGGFGLTLGPIVWLYIPEIVEPHIIPYSTMTNLLGAAVCIIVFPIASAQLPNKAYLFGIFLVWAVVSMLINQRFLVETKDKPRDQVYREQKEIQLRFCRCLQ